MGRTALRQSTILQTGAVRLDRTLCQTTCLPPLTLQQCTHGLTTGRGEKRSEECGLCCSMDTCSWPVICPPQAYCLMNGSGDALSIWRLCTSVSDFTGQQACDGALFGWPEQCCSMLKPSCMMYVMCVAMHCALSTCFHNFRQT